MRFHSLDDKDTQRIRTLRFTRALFGMRHSPFVLAGVVECYLNASREKYPQTCGQNRELYVDNLVSGGTSEDKVQEKRQAFA